MLQGNRDNIESMAGGSQKVLGQVLKLIDLYDLYGSVAYPKVGAAVLPLRLWSTRVPHLCMTVLTG